MARADTAEIEERVAKLRALLDRDPDDATSWFTLGRALFDLGRGLLEAGEVAEAARVLKSALELARETGDLQTGREMETFLQRAEKILGVPSQPKSFTPQRPAEATPSARDADPEAKALYRRGFEHFANDRHDEAIALYEQALHLDPGLAIAWNGLSLAHRQKGDLEAAIAAGRRLIELEPDDALSHTNLSILYQRRGMIPEAEEEKAIAMQIQMKQQARQVSRSEPKASEDHRGGRR
jgi:tetratricopeptide (TPR) repeat protein